MSRCGIQLLLAGALLGCAGLGHAANPNYAPDVETWQEIPVPPKGKNADRVVWDYASDYSKLKWRVYLAIATPEARLVDRAADPIPFAAPTEGFQGGDNRFKRVDDGWLVGSDHGEFGAALSWFGPEGDSHYLISNAHVREFFSRQDGIYAIEGLDHMGLSCGSVIRISRQRPSAHWHASEVLSLPQAPNTVSVRRDGSILIVLSNSLVSIGSDHQIKTLISDAPWESLYPNSAVLLPDESRLYIGMRQFVGEVDLTTNRLRMLVPSASYLNKLPEDMERRIRAEYPKGMSDDMRLDCEKVKAATHGAGAGQRTPPGP